MEQAILYQSAKPAFRIKMYIPYNNKEWRQQIKQLTGSWYHPNQKLWSVPNDTALIEQVKKIIGDNYKTEQISDKKEIPKKILSKKSEDILGIYQQKIILKGYSESTLKSYASSFIQFLSYFESYDVVQLNKDQIEEFIYHLKSKYKISEQKQNLCINAIKFYYEQVLGKPKEYYEITRPKKSQQLPNVLSKMEVKTLLNQPKNLKH